jgi:phosphoribosylformylglycinamidine synthase
MDLKNAGDEIFLVGNNSLDIIEVIGISIANCKVIEEAIEKNILSSSYAIGFGGIGIGLAKMSIAGQLGIDAQLDEENLFSETPSRFLVTIAKENVEQFSKIAFEKNASVKKFGTVLSSNNFTVKNLRNENIIETTVEELENHYKKTFRNY